MESWRSLIRYEDRDSFSRLESLFMVVSRMEQCMKRRVFKVLEREKMVNGSVYS